MLDINWIEEESDMLKKGWMFYNLVALLSSQASLPQVV